MRWRTILEGVHQEAELLLSLFWSESEDLEYLLLQLGVVDTNAAATNLNTVHYHIIGIGTNAGWVCVEQRNIFWLG